MSSPASNASRCARRSLNAVRHCHRQKDLEEIQEVAGLFQVLRQHGARFRITCIRIAKQARLVGQEGKPESYYFPPQHNNVGNNFPYTFMGLEPGTTKAQVRRCLENWNKGDNGILDLSRAYRLKPGTGWLIPPCILHAPGSLCTYEPQWGSDVFGMYQSLVEGREVPWSLLVKDMPKKQTQRPRFHRRPTRLGRECRPEFQGQSLPRTRSRRRYTQKEGYVDRWIVYGKVDGEQLFTAKELTVEPGAKCTIKDNGAYGLICVQGNGKMNGCPLNSPKLIRFTELTEDEVLLHRRRRQSRRDLREHKRNRTAGGPALLRTRSESGCSSDGRLQEGEVAPVAQRLVRSKAATVAGRPARRVI